jgi:aspartate aminotransferase-like enzyme
MRRQLKIETPDGLVAISKDTPVDIEVEQGMAYTKEGQKATMQELMKTMIEAVQVQAIPAAALQSVFQKYLEIYQFGSTEEFMEDLEEAMKEGTPMNEQQTMQMKVAILEALKEAGEVGPEASQKRVMENKVGVLEALHESGLSKNMTPPVKESVSINYKDAPEDIKRQMEEKAGFQSLTSSRQAPLTRCSNMPRP